MQALRLTPILAIAIILNACSPTIDMPKGTSTGYRSARLIERNTDAEITDDAVAVAKEKKVHGMFQKSIQNEFTQHGLSYGKADADLKVAYLVMIQNNAITFHYNDYFGNGRGADAIAEYAHLKGATESRRDEFFERFIILVDVIDAQTNKLIYRNHYAKDIVDVPSDAVRAKRIDAMTKEILAPFFAM